MKRLRFLIIFILTAILIVFLIYLFLSYAKSLFIKKKLNLENEIARLKSEYTFFKYQIDSINDGKVAFTFFFLDQDGNIFTNGSLVLDGSDIFLESRVIFLNPSNSIVFPLRLYSESVSPDKGFNLTNFYANREFLFYPEKKEMGRFFEAIFSFYVLGEGNIDRYKHFVKFYMDVVIHSGLPLQEGDVFECVLHPGGQLELKRSEL
ncbi:MAG: hypothetical protein ACP5QT_00425 [Brevinematia bacterium]